MQTCPDCQAVGHGSADCPTCVLAWTHVSDQTRAHMLGAIARRLAAEVRRLRAMHDQPAVAGEAERGLPAGWIAEAVDAVGCVWQRDTGDRRRWLSLPPAYAAAYSTLAGLNAVRGPLRLRQWPPDEPVPLIVHRPNCDIRDGRCTTCRIRPPDVPGDAGKVYPPLNIAERTRSCARSTPRRSARRWPSS